jgi:predicted dehydrogenase
MTSNRAAVIGLGIMGRRMLANLDRHPNFEIAGMWDPSEASTAKAKAEFPSAPISDDPSVLITKDVADVVYIACPPEWHKHYALMAIEAGVAVYTEKPLGVDIAESQDLVRRLEETSTPNVVNFVQASCEALALTQSALSSDKLGDITGVEIVVQYQQWPREWQVEADWLRYRAAGGYVREVISHFVFVTERLFGPAQITFSQPSYPADPKLCETHLQTRLDCSGIPVNIFGSCGGIGPDRQEITVWGTKASHRISDFYFLATTDGGEWRGALPPDTDPRATALQRQLDNVAKWLEKKPHGLPSAADALSVQRVIEGILAPTPSGVTKR